MINPGNVTLLAFLLLFAVKGMVRQLGTRPENLIKQPRREQIVKHLQQHPGTNISELCRDLNTSWGTLQHHLHLLKRAGLVRSKSVGRDHQYFAADVEPQKMDKIAVIRRGRVPELVQAILRRPGIIQSELVIELDMHRKVMRRYLDLLKVEGLIKETRISKNRLYYALPPLQELGPLMAASEPEAAGASAKPEPVQHASEVA